MGEIVVGVDGSPGSRAALEFAAAEARRWDAPLRLVHVARPPTTNRGGTGLLGEYASEEAFRATIEREDAESGEAFEHARQRAELTVDRLQDQVDTEGLELRRTVLLDRRPARRLIDVVNGSDEVELLVVGSRGRGELTGVLLGSVSQAAVTHARVPVTVIPRPRG